MTTIKATEQKGTAVLISNIITADRIAYTSFVVKVGAVVLKKSKYHSKYNEAVKSRGNKQQIPEHFVALICSSYNIDREDFRKWAKQIERVGESKDTKYLDTIERIDRESLEREAAAILSEKRKVATGKNAEQLMNGKKTSRFLYQVGAGYLLELMMMADRVSPTKLLDKLQYGTGNVATSQSLRWAITSGGTGSLIPTTVMALVADLYDVKYSGVVSMSEMLERNLENGFSSIRDVLLNISKRSLERELVSE